MADKRIFTDVLEVGIVVRNLEEAIKRYEEIAGFDGWKIFENNSVTLPDGAPGPTPAYRLAVLNVTPVQWKLIQPRDDRSIYAKFLKEHGEGLHHVACAVSDYENDAGALTQNGISITQLETIHDSRYTHFDTQGSLCLPIAITDRLQNVESDGGKSQSSSTKPVFTEVLQVACVVKDLDETLKRYAEIAGLDQWRVVEFNPTIVSDMIVNDRRQDYAMRLGLGRVGSVNWELIQPLDDKSIYADFLKEHGEGFHHVACAVNGYEQTVAFFRGKGIGIAQGGTLSANTYTYFDTQASLSAIIEVYSRPPGR